MGLLSAFKGDVLHFNKNAVPVWNDIVEKINSFLKQSNGGIFITKNDTKEMFQKVLQMTQICILDMLFHPDTGVIKDKVKALDRQAFYELYEIVVLFLLSTYKNIRPQQADELKEMFVSAVGRVQECNEMWQDLDKSYTDSNKLIEIVRNRVTNYTGRLENKEESGLTSAFRGIVVTFIQDL